MESSDEIVRLLTEIRDLQRDHLAEYRRVSQRSLETQDQAMQVAASSVGRQRLALVAVIGVLVLFGLYLVLLAQR